MIKFSYEKFWFDFWSGQFLTNVLKIDQLKNWTYILEMNFFLWLWPLSSIFTFMKIFYCLTLRSLINVQSVINVQGDQFSKKNKRTGRKSSSISVQVSFFQPSWMTPSSTFVWKSKTTSVQVFSKSVQSGFFWKLDKRTQYVY